MRADSGVFVYGFCYFVLNFHDYQLIYTSQYWLRSYAIQFIWNMMDNDDGIEWQTHLVRPLVFMCTVYKCKHNHFVHTHAERGRWRERHVWLSATDYQSNLHIAWKWDDFCCRYCEQWTMAIAIWSAYAIFRRQTPKSAHFKWDRKNREKTFTVNNQIIYWFVTSISFRSFQLIACFSEWAREKLITLQMELFK